MTSSVPSRGEAGFTLIELLVVILIIGILAAIGIPALLSQRDKAKNSAAKSAVRTALTAAKTYYTEEDNFDGLDAAALDRIEPTLYVKADYDTGTAGNQLIEPGVTNGAAAAAGDTAEPKDIWISNGTATKTAPSDEAVLLCSVSKGNSIACIYNDEGTGNVKYKEFVEGKGSVTGNPSLTNVNGAAGGIPTSTNVDGDTF